MRKTLTDEFFDALDQPYLWPIRAAVFMLGGTIAFGIFYVVLNGGAQ